MSLKYNSYILAVKRKGKKGNRVTLHQRLYYQGEQWQVALRISVPEEYYNEELSYVVKGEERDSYNRIIQGSLNTIRDLFLRYELVEHKTPTLEDITSAYEREMIKQGLFVDKKLEKQISDLFIDHIDEFIDAETKAKNWSESTSKKFATLKKRLGEFKEERGISLSLSTLTEKQLYDFMDFWSDAYDLLNTSMQKNASFIRWYLRWCNKQGLYKGNLFETFRPKYKGGNFEQHKIIYLTEEELRKVEYFEFPNEKQYLARARDVFVFACYCGLRYSDMKKLKPQDIHDDLIEIVTVKTNDLMTINLNKHTREIADKYKEWSEVSNRALPVPSNQDLNRYVHEVMKMCGIDSPTMQVYYQGEKRKEVCVPKYDLITFHAARRTFITHALRLGMPVPVIMKFSGHHSVNMLKPYMQVVDELKKKEMAKFDTM